MAQKDNSFFTVFYEFKSAGSKQVITDGYWRIELIV